MQPFKHVLRIAAVYTKRTGKYKQTLNYANRHQARAVNSPAATDGHIDYDRCHLNQSLFARVEGGDLKQCLNSYLCDNGYAATDPTTNKAVDGRPLFTDKQQTKILMEGLLTVGVDFFDTISPDWRAGVISADMQLWIDSAMAYIRDTHGDTAIMANLHLDETAPHIHFYVVPDTEVTQLKRGRPKAAEERQTHVVRALNYNALYQDDYKDWLTARNNNTSATSTICGRMQTSYSEYMTKCAPHLALRRGDRNSKTMHKPFRQHTAEQAVKIEQIIQHIPQQATNVADLLSQTDWRGKLTPAAAAEVAALIEQNNIMAATDLPAILAQAERERRQRLHATEQAERLAASHKVATTEVAQLKVAERKSKQDLSAVTDEKRLLTRDLEKAREQLDKVATAEQMLRGMPLAETAQRMRLHPELHGKFDAATFKKHYPTEAAAIRVRNSVDLVKAIEGKTYVEAVGRLRQLYRNDPNVTYLLEQELGKAAVAELAANSATTKVATAQSMRL